MRVPLTNLRPRVKEIIPPKRITIRKLRMSFVLKDKGGNFILIDEKDFI